jgi:tetratricopeptide (TPR) repeat protein
MRPTDKIERSIKETKYSADAATRNRILDDAQAAMAKTQGTALAEPAIWRIIMESKITKFAVATVVIVTMGLLAYYHTGSVDGTSTVWAIEQTVRALENVDNIHIIMHNNNGKVTDERWITLDPNGVQKQYRQESNELGLSIVIVDDGKQCQVYYPEKKTVVAYDHGQKTYQWFGNLRQLFITLAGKGQKGEAELFQNYTLDGKPTYKVRLVELNIDCYIDPDTSLPIKVGPYDVSYEPFTAEKFIFAAPDGTAVIDKRTGAAVSKEPDWLQNDKVWESLFLQGKKELAAMNYLIAVDLLSRSVELQPLNNWGLYYLGDAYYHLGQYDRALAAYTKVTDMFAKFGIDAPYCHFAKGISYAAMGQDSAANVEIKQALPVMLKALRNSKECSTFDYADYPLYQQATKEDRDKIASFGISNMVRRLIKVSGKRFGEKELITNNISESTIVAWEQWYKNNGQVHVDNSYKLEFILPREIIIAK